MKQKNKNKKSDEANELYFSTSSDIIIHKLASKQNKFRCFKTNINSSYIPLTMFITMLHNNMKIFEVEFKKPISVGTNSKYLWRRQQKEGTKNSIPGKKTHMTYIWQMISVLRFLVIYTHKRWQPQLVFTIK